MIVAKLVGSVLDKKFLGGQVGLLTERYHSAIFIARLAKALRTRVNAESAELANDVAEAIRAAVPVDTGSLKDSVRVVPNKKGARVIEGGTSDTMKEIRSGGPGQFDQALGIEYGTSNRSAQPHFYPSAKRFEKRIEKSLRDAIEDEVG